MNGIVIFDMDGTLIDTLKMTMVAMERSCPQFHLPVRSRSLIRRSIGLANADFYAALYPDAPADIRAALSQMVEERENAVALELRDGLLFPGVRAMLEALRAAGIPLCLASTGTASHVYTALEAASIKSFFQSIHCGEPDKSEMVGRILRHYPDHGPRIYIGDSRKDVTAARDNSMLLYGAGFGYAADDERDLFDAVFDTTEEMTEKLLKAFS